MPNQDVDSEKSLSFDSDSGEFNASVHESNRNESPLQQLIPEKPIEAEPIARVDMFYKAKHFQAFQYEYNLTRDCKSRVEKILLRNDIQDEMVEDVFIKIGIVGKFTDADLKFISKGRVKGIIPRDGEIWKASPLVCFQNDFSLPPGFEILGKESGCNTILVMKSKNTGYEKDKDEFPINVVHTREQLHRSITTCLNKPLRKMLEDWLQTIGAGGLGKQAAKIKAEIEAIRKQMTFDDCDETAAASVSPILRPQFIVPENVKNYLFRNSDINSFGLWMKSSFKVFVKKATDEKRLKDELMNLNRTFFEKYRIEIETSRIVLKQTWRQGDAILTETQNGGKYCEGTLGGFVTKVDDKTKVYALTCNHLFPNINQSAFIEDAKKFKEIGLCMFTTRDQSCDFAAIEIKESLVNECDIALRRDDKKKVNAKVNTQRLDNVGIVHKIGKATDVTTGIIISPEYYDKVVDDGNRECLFLVKGTNAKFSTEGDSGSLVFCRPRSVQQTHIDILGMVYANNLTVHDDDDDDDDDDKGTETSVGSQNEGAVKMQISAGKSAPIVEESGASASNSEENSGDISCCYRIHTALGLFEDKRKKEDEKFEVKFQDDLSSHSSNSDDSSEETLE